MRNGFIALAMACWYLMASGAPRPPTELLICYEDANSRPWQIKGGHGLNYQLIRMASQISGVPVRQVAMPWNRCLRELETGAVSGVAGASFTDERGAYAAYPRKPDGKLDVAKRERNDSYSLYRLVGSPIGWDGTHFSHLAKPIGAQHSYSVVGDLRKAGIDVDEANWDSESLTSQLVLGRFQMIAMLTGQGNALLASPVYAGKVERLNRVFEEKTYFVPFNKGFFESHRDLVERFWNGLAIARDSNAYRKLSKEAS